MNKRAIIVAGGKNNDISELLNRQDGDVVIGVDGGAFALLEAQIKVDVAIGDFDSVTNEQFQILEKEIEQVIKMPAEKDLTDTEAALEFVVKELAVDEIWMLGLFGGRLDHLMSNLWLAYQPRFQEVLSKIRILDSENVLRFYQPGQFELKIDPSKTYLSFIGMTALRGLKLEQVKYPLAGNDYQYPIALVSNEFLADSMTFSFNEGLLAVIQSKDRR